jgi:hypothetical protein
MSELKEIILSVLVGVASLAAIYLFLVFCLSF